MSRLCNLFSMFCEYALVNVFLSELIAARINARSFCTGLQFVELQNQVGRVLLILLFSLVFRFFFLPFHVIISFGFIRQI